MTCTHGYGKFLGLTEPEQRVLLYSILYATHDGRASPFYLPTPSHFRYLLLTFRQNPVNFEKLASELGYTVVSAKVITTALAVS
jgi:hypothetical protein